MKIVPYLNQSVNYLVYQSVNQFLISTSQSVKQYCSLMFPGGGLSDLVKKNVKDDTVYLLWFKYELKQNKI